MQTGGRRGLRLVEPYGSERSRPSEVPYSVGRDRRARRRKELCILNGAPGGHALPDEPVSRSYPAERDCAYVFSWGCASAQRPGYIFLQPSN